MRYAMAIDTRKCVGCSDCVVACQTENDVPIGYCRDWVVEVTDGTYPQLELELRSERCNHCDNAPCVRCCPTGASHFSDGGIVLVKENRCIGCGACIASCPYDARYPHPDGYVDKCTFCIHRVRKGQKPACVEVCPDQVHVLRRPRRSQQRGVQRAQAPQIQGPDPRSGHRTHVVLFNLIPSCAKN
jgi:Fe-S-cluster-containing dehydrogenase component